MDTLTDAQRAARLLGKLGGAAGKGSPARKAAAINANKIRWDKIRMERYRQEHPMTTRRYTIIALDRDGNQVFSATYRATCVDEAKTMCELECAGQFNAETFKHLR